MGLTSGLVVQASEVLVWAPRPAQSFGAMLTMTEAEGHRTRPPIPRLRALTPLSPSSGRCNESAGHGQMMDVEASYSDFINCDRTGRRNAVPDITREGGQGPAGTSELAKDMAEMDLKAAGELTLWASALTHLQPPGGFLPFWVLAPSPVSPLWMTRLLFGTSVSVLEEFPMT